MRLGPLPTRDKGRDRVIVRALDSRLKVVFVVLIEGFVRIYVGSILLEVGLTQILAYRETLPTICHVGIHVDFSDSSAFTF